MKRKGEITALEAGLTLGFPTRRHARGLWLRFLGGHEGAKRHSQCCSEQRLYGLLGELGSARVHSLQRETDSVEHVFRNHEANRLLGIDHLADTHVGHKR